MWRRLAPLVGIVPFSLCAWVLMREIEHTGLAAIARSLASVSGSALGAAGALTAINYVVLTLNDYLAFRYAHVRMPAGRILAGSFVGCAISNNIGFALVSGTSARYRFYAREGVAPADLSRIVLFYMATFWTGLCLVGGASLALAPPPGLATLVPGRVSTGIGAAAVLLVVTYATLCLVRREPVRFGRIALAPPQPRLLAAQVAVSVADWLLAPLVLFTLLPGPRPPFVMFTGAFAGAQLAGIASHVPGGVGVFEGLMVLLLPDVSAGAFVPALLTFRIVYYLLPLATALIVLLVDEALQRRGALIKCGIACQRLAAVAAPPALAVFTFASGAVLLFSGATPAVPSRIEPLSRVMPLPLLEASHFTASLVGLVLLLLAQAVARRIDAAFYITAIALAIGSAASLLKGADYEEATLLALVLGALVAARRHFTRRARVFEDRLSPGWLAAIVVVIAASVWLGSFAYQHVAFSRDLWWRFEFNGDAPRFLRASVGVVVLALILGVRDLLRLVIPIRRGLDAAAIADIDRVIARQARALPNLVYLGDKSILWNPERTAFLMYSVHGRSAVVLGDPVGPADTTHLLIARFLAMCDRVGLMPVFYEASGDRLADFADHGMTAVKIGEEARVPLQTFSLVGSRFKGLRSAINRTVREGCSFRVADARAVPALIPELQEVSDEWLEEKGASEKGFSLGYFTPEYLNRFPVALIERGGRIEAFANLWTTSAQAEISPDLMRQRADAPPGTMDALFAQLMVWGREGGFQWFNLGMAPLSRLPPAPVGRAWTRFGDFIYRHGEAFYNFQGLRAYKEKFNPTWEPRYLVYPGGLTLARALADVAALVAGGYGRIFLRSVRRAA